MKYRYMLLYRSDPSSMSLLVYLWPIYDWLVRRPGAEETQLGHAHQAVEVQPAVVSADRLLAAADVAPGEARRSAEVDEAAPDPLRQRQTEHVEVAEGTVDLVPGVTGQPFIGALAGLGDL